MVFCVQMFALYIFVLFRKVQPRIFAVFIWEFQLSLSSEAKVWSTWSIIIGIRFEANSSASPKHGVLLPPPLLPQGSLCNYHYPQADTPPCLSYSVAIIALIQQLCRDCLRFEKLWLDRNYFGDGDLETSVHAIELKLNFARNLRDAGKGVCF